MKLFYLICSVLLVTSCVKKTDETQFPEEVLRQELTTEDNQNIEVGEAVLPENGQPTLIKIWASWCGDCMKSLPKVKQFQEEYPDINYVFISVDDEKSAWENGLQKHISSYNFKGNQYLLTTGWKKDKESPFILFTQLDWIPRYILLDEYGNILVYNATDIRDSSISEMLVNY